MRKFRVRLTLIMALLIGASVLGAGMISTLLFERTHIEELQKYLTRELNVLLTTVDWKNTGNRESLIAQYEGQIRLLKQSADVSLTYVSVDGSVIADSDQDPHKLVNQSRQQEIQNAIQSGTGYAMRYSDTLKMNMFYAALPVKGNDGSTIGVLRIAISLSEVESGVRRLWTYVISGMLALFVVGSFISYRIAKGVTRPIEMMTHVAGRISARDYTARVHVRGIDEMGQLARAINRMAESLQNQVTHITENESRLQSVLANMVSGVMMIGRDECIAMINPAAERILGFSSRELTGQRYDSVFQQFHLAKLIRDCFEHNSHVKSELTFYFPAERIVEVSITPIGHTEDWPGLLVVLHDITDIRRLERMRSEFVANVSHELKTPIAAVKGFAETLMAGALNDKETAQSFLKIIYDESERLNRLVGDILELSKIESKRTALQLSPVHLQTVTEQCMQMVQTTAENKRITTEMRVPEWLYAEADEDRLRQILMNLLTNGISYTPEGGKVTVSADIVNVAAGERMRIVVSDTGIGIPKDDLPRIFERFYRVDKARSRSSGGTGLGLSIVKHLVELHRGTIRVESEVGMGSRFIVELPVVHDDEL
jgi:two-component system, OmpR family, phosphate regulon sensor histidine kinase PhoR